jgi:hypothetical protein
MFEAWSVPREQESNLQQPKRSGLCCKEGYHARRVRMKTGEHQRGISKISIA